jgi:hypothetical protein
MSNFNDLIESSKRVLARARKATDEFEAIERRLDSGVGVRPRHGKKARSKKARG